MDRTLRRGLSSLLPLAQAGTLRRGLVALALSLAPFVLGGCKNDAQKYLSVGDARLAKGEGIALTAGGAAQIGHSVLVAGTLTNAHPSKTAINVHLEVKLFRKAGDPKPAHVYDEFSIKGLERVGPGQKATFSHYVKSSLGGYEACDVHATAANFVD